MFWFKYLLLKTSQSRTKEQILAEYNSIYTSCNNKSKENRESIPYAAKTYYESILEDFHRQQQASRKAWLPLIDWMKQILPEVDQINDISFAQTFRSEISRLEGFVNSIETEPTKEEYDNYYDLEVLKWYLDGNADINQQIIPLLDKHDIPYDIYTFPTGKKVMRIETDPPKNRWESGGFLVIEKDKEELNYWEDPEEWVNYASDRSYEYLVEKDFSKDFWDGVGDGYYLYHATSEENIESIMENGLEARADTRGLSNRDMGAAVFTVGDENYDDISGVLSSYGDKIIQIDIGKMKRDGYMPVVAEETPLAECEIKQSLAAYIDFDDYVCEQEDDYISGTIAIYGDIPPQYLVVL